MNTTTQTQDLRGWIGRDLVDESGGKIGTIEELYLDDETGQPEWITVKTGLLGTKVSFVPLRGTSSGGEALVSPWDKAKVKGAPSIDPDAHLSPQEEDELYRYYGIASTNGHVDTNAAYGRVETNAKGRAAVDRDVDVDADRRRGSADSAMTRSEEELEVAKTRHQTGKARLRKWIETEHEAVTVPRQREEVRVEREPITDANRDSALSGPDLREAEYEVTLHEEEVVADKKVVPKERVRLDKTVVTEEERVDAELRKEHIEVEGDVPARAKARR